MSYSNKLAACIVSNGQILREEGSDVRLPFGSEYAIRVKNLNTTRVAVSIFIDDVDVLNGSKIVIDPNESHDIEGFMNGNTIRNRFRFIEKTKEISEYRGDRIGDGIVRVEFQFEKPLPIVMPPVEYPYRKKWYNDDIYWGSNGLDGTTLSDYSVGNVKYGSRGPRASSCNSQSLPTSFFKGILRGSGIEQNEDGITVKGSETNQHYNTTYLREMEEQKHVVIFTLKGEIEEIYKGNVVKKKSKKPSARVRKSRV